LLLIFFILISTVGATEDIEDLDNLSESNSQVIVEESEFNEVIQSDNEDYSEISANENTEDSVFVNPNFDNGTVTKTLDMSAYVTSGWGWYWSDQNASANDVEISNGVYTNFRGQQGYLDNDQSNKVLHVYQDYSGYYPVVYQMINFDNVDNISFKYVLPYQKNYTDASDGNTVKDFDTYWVPYLAGEINGRTLGYLNHTLEIYCDDNLIDSIIIDPKYGWQTAIVNTKEYSGEHLFKIKIIWAELTNNKMYHIIYFDNFTAVMAPVPEQVDSIISISSINANNVVSGFLKDISGNPLANAVINYTINDNNGSVVTADDGSFSINGVDNYEIFINYLGNKTIKATSTSIKLDNLTGPLVEAQANASKLAGDLADANQKISNLTTQLSDAQTNPVLLNTNVVVSDLNIKAGESGVLKVTLKDASGIGLANQTINVLINGKNYNAVTGNDGVAQVSLKYDGANTYYANIYYAGNGTYKSSIATGKVVVTKKATTLTAPKKTFKVKAKTKKVAITLKSNGKAVAGKKITIKIKGKTYSAKTNSKGVATIKVKLTKKGTYKYTAKFAGDNTYNTISKKGTIKVKK
jgi:hypothetical protein